MKWNGGRGLGIDQAWIGHVRSAGSSHVNSSVLPLISRSSERNRSGPEMLRLKSLLHGHHYFIIGLVLLLCIRASQASNYFAYIHEKEPTKPATDRPMSMFKTKLLRLCALYARGQRVQERLIALDMDGTAIGRRLEAPPQICRPILSQLATAPKMEGPEVVPASVIFGEDTQRIYEKRA